MGSEAFAKLEEAKANCRELQNKVSDKAALLAELTGPKVRL